MNATLRAWKLKQIMLADDFLTHKIYTISCLNFSSRFTFSQTQALQANATIGAEQIEMKHVTHKHSETFQDSPLVQYFDITVAASDSVFKIKSKSFSFWILESRKHFCRY